MLGGGGHACLGVCMPRGMHAQGETCMPRRGCMPRGCVCPGGMHGMHPPRLILRDTVSQ